MKKKIILTTTLIIISSIIILLSYKKEDNITFLGAVNNKNNLLSIMLETSSGSGNYQESSSNSFPTNGYIFNENLSGCENGSKISWDEENNRISVESNKTDKCYIYFDMYTPTLAETITKLYTGVQGENGLYYHDSNLTNGANDNSYRYAGSDPDNYVCFGSDEETCPTDNLYRIIGVFDGRVKIIKADYATSSLLGIDGDYKETYSTDKTDYKGSLSISDIGGYMWNYNANNIESKVWTTSLLNKTNLNINYLNNIGSKWVEMIDTTTWNVGSNAYTKIRDVIPSVAYQNEIVNPATSTTYEAKIGLMYVSDYGFAADPSAWEIKLYNYAEKSIPSKNWMYMGLFEWTISPDASSGQTYDVFYVRNTGKINSNSANTSYSIRPVFFLSSLINCLSGDGTKTNPYRIS